MSDQVVRFTIDGREVTVPKGTTVYTAATQLGIDIPIFCYQDRMPPFGACRVCLVEVEKIPKLQTSCTLEATEGMVVKTTARAEKGREEILELLLINHPLDCPICDRGGECPLQDQALKFGPGESRFFEDKRRFKKPISLGPVLMLDRERCIVCARCTRFGDLVAGDHALELIDRGYRSEVGTPSGGPAESKFIGNTIMICPVGALTSRVYRFRARPWDNEPTESCCTLCPVGCNMILDARDGEIMRTRSQENKSLNDIWLCDKGWFGYEFSSSPERLQTPLMRSEGKFIAVSWEEALDLIVEKINSNKAGGKLAGWGGNPLTVEENYLFQQLMRQGAGVNHVDHRVGSAAFSLEEEGFPNGMDITVGECSELSSAFFLGLDLTEEFPVIWLRVKEAINRGAKTIFIGHYAPEIAPHLTKTVLHAPGKELEMIRQELGSYKPDSGKNVIFVGSQYLNSPNRKAILAELMKFKQWKLQILEGKGNCMGARVAGMHPALGPLGQKIGKPGLSATQVLESAAKNGWDFLYVAGADPVARYPSWLWREMRQKLGFLVVQDLFLTKTAQEADLVLPTLAYVEKHGHFINIAGQVQKLHPGKALPQTVFSDGEIFSELLRKLHLDGTVPPSFQDALQSTIKLERPASLTAAFTELKKGLKATFAPALFDEGVRMRHDQHLIHLAKKPHVRLHPDDASKLNLQEKDEVRVSANGHGFHATLRLDKNVAHDTAVLPLGFEKVSVYELSPHLLNGMSIEIHKGN